MKLRIYKKDLLDAVQTILGVVSVRNTLPILSNILLESKKGQLQLTATDLDIAMVHTQDAEVSQEGAATVPAKRFADIIKELPDEDVTISAKKNNIVTIDCQSAHFKVNSLPKEDFPKLPNYKSVESINIEQKAFKEMLNMTTFAISRDETRYILNGVLMEVKPQKINLVATDGRRLAYVERAIETKTKKERKVIIPTKTTNELNKTLAEGELKIYFAENQVTFDLGKTIIISRLIEGEFPNYQQVIPKEQKRKLRVDKELLLAAARRANLLTSQDSQAIKLDIFKNRMVVSKNTPDIGEAREELSTKYEGGELSIGFNPNYLIDVLKNIDVQEIGFELTANDKPGVIRTRDNFVYVVLPMHLG